MQHPRFAPYTGVCDNSAKARMLPTVGGFRTVTVSRLERIFPLCAFNSVIEAVIAAAWKQTSSKPLHHSVCAPEAIVWPDGLVGSIGPSKNR